MLYVVGQSKIMQDLFFLVDVPKFANLIDCILFQWKFIPFSHNSIFGFWIPLQIQRNTSAFFLVDHPISIQFSQVTGNGENAWFSDFWAFPCPFHFVGTSSSVSQVLLCHSSLLKKSAALPWFCGWSGAWKSADGGYESSFNRIFWIQETAHFFGIKFYPTNKCDLIVMNLGHDMLISAKLKNFSVSGIRFVWVTSAASRDMVVENARIISYSPLALLNSLRRRWRERYPKGSPEITQQKHVRLFVSCFLMLFERLCPAEKVMICKSINNLQCCLTRDRNWSTSCVPRETRVNRSSNSPCWAAAILSFAACSLLHWSSDVVYLCV